MNKLHLFVTFDIRLRKDPVYLNLGKMEKRNSAYEVLMSIYCYLMEIPNLVGNYKLNYSLYG